MKPVVFQGSIPENLLSQEAKARIDRELAVAAPAPNVAEQVALLNSDLSEHDTQSIVTAMNVMLADKEGKVSRSDAKRLTKRALQHLEGDCTSPITSHPSRHWRFWENSIFRILAELPLAKMPECRDILTELQLKVLHDGLSKSGFPADYFHDSLNQAAIAIHSVDTNAAEELELRAMTMAERYVPRRQWAFATHNVKGAPQHTEAFLKRAWPKMSEYQRKSFAEQVELNWLPEDYAVRMFCSGNYTTRCKAFTAATPQTIMRAIRGFMASDANSAPFAVPNASVMADALIHIPAWKEFSKDIKLLREAFRDDWLSRNAQQGNLRLDIAKLELMGGLMQRGMPASNCIAMSDHVWSTAVRTLQGSLTRSTAKANAHILFELVRMPFLSIGPAALHTKLLQMNLLANGRLCPGGRPLHESAAEGNSPDDGIRRHLKFLEVDASVSNAYRAAFIDAGLISINAVRPADQRKDIIGPALARNPGRLAEVEDIERFVELARRFQIPIELPADVNEAFRMQASMRAVMVAPAAAADPLADAAPATPEARPRRRARA